MKFLKVWFYVKKTWKFLARTAKIVAPFATLASVIIAYNSFKFAKQVRDEGSETTRRTVAMIASMKANTDEISSNMKAISEATSAFKNSLQEIRVVMKEQAKSFESSIATLQTSIGSFNSSLQRQENVINALAAATEKSVQVLRQRTELLEKELSKSPKFTLVAEEVTYDSLGVLNVQLWLINSGNIFSTKQTILLLVPKEYHFESSGYRVARSGKPEEVWSLTQEVFIGYMKFGEGAFKINNSLMNFKIRPSAGNTSIRIRYQIAHEGGNEENYLTINVPKKQ